MDSFSGKTTDKLVASITTNFSYRSNWLLKYSGDFTENFESTAQLPKRYLRAGGTTITNTWPNSSERGSCHVSNVTRKHELRTE